MEDVALFFRVVLALLFLSAAVSKLLHFEEHVGIVNDYKIVPETLVRPFSMAELGGELLVGLLLLLGLFPKVAALGAIGLLLMYVIAISINLYRGRTEISCGCGGAAGHHNLSWWLVVRNVLLILIGGWLYVQNSAWSGMQAIPVLMSAALSMVLLAITNEFRTITARIRELLNN